MILSYWDLTAVYAPFKFGLALQQHFWFLHNQRNERWEQKSKKETNSEYYYVQGGIWWGLWFLCSCWEQKESLWGTVCQSNLRAFQWLHTSKVRSRVRWMDVRSLAGFSSAPGNAFSITPLPRKNKMETKQKRNKKWLQLPSRGEHNPVLLAFQINGEIRFQNGICNSHANCQAVEA